MFRPAMYWNHTSNGMEYYINGQMFSKQNYSQSRRDQNKENFSSGINELCFYRKTHKAGTTISKVEIMNNLIPWTM